MVKGRAEFRGRAKLVRPPPLLPGDSVFDNGRSAALGMVRKAAGLSPGATRNSDEA